MTTSPPPTASTPAPSEPAARRSPWLVASGGFVAGAVAGALLVWAVMSGARPPPEGPPGGQPAGHAARHVSALADAALDRPRDAGPVDAEVIADAAAEVIGDAAVDAGPAVAWPELPVRAAPVIALRRTIPLDDGRWLYAARTEATRGEWRRLIGRWPGLDARDPDRPMVELTAGQAAWFCNQLSAREGLSPCYAPCPDPRRCREIPAPQRPCDGYRLPTRAEWTAIADRVDVDAARARSRALRPGAPVCGSVDGLDLCDLYGGVWEWTETARRFRGQPAAFRMGGSWDPGHRDVYREAIQQLMGNPQPFVGLRPVRAAVDPRLRIGGLVYDPLSRRLFGQGHVAALDPDRAVLFERLVRSGGRLPATGTSAVIRSGLGAALVPLGVRVDFDGSQVVLSPPAAERSPRGE